MTIIHKHHLVPKHRGGKDADGLVEVTPIQHAMFHYCEWRLHGHWQDKTAWRMLVEYQKYSREGANHTEESKKKMSEIRKMAFTNPVYREKHKQRCIARYMTEEGKRHLKQNGVKAMKKMINNPEFQQKRLEGLRKKCEIIHKIEKGGVVEYMTKRQFINKYGGNLASCKQRVWKCGVYKGWKFSQSVV